MNFILKIFNINSKGQSDIVFEVLVAVILMSFVLTAGAYAMNSLSTTKCSKQIDASLSDLTRSIETALSSAITQESFLFSIPSCFSNKHKVSILKTEGDICLHYCPGVTNKCVLLKYEDNKDKVQTIRYKCINISYVTLINPNSCGQKIGEYSLYKDQNNEIDRGKYLFTSNSFKTPILCIYKRGRK